MAMDIFSSLEQVARSRQSNLAVSCKKGTKLRNRQEGVGNQASYRLRIAHAIHVTTADVTDRAGALAMFDRRRDGLSQVQNVLVDGGYTGKPFATAVQGLLGAAVEVVKRNELHTFVVLPKRWVVERSFAWLEKCRRLWKNLLNTSLQMVVLAFTVLILKRL